MARREYVGGASTTTLNGALGAGATTINITDGTGWPTGGTGPFCIDIDYENSSYEKVLVLSRSGNVLTVNVSGDRGYDNTSDTSHLDGATVRHVVSSIDLDEANAHINNVGAVKHTSDALATDSVGTAQIAAGAVDSAEIANGAIDLVHMSANSVDSDQYVDGSIDGVHIANDQIDSQHYAAGSIDLEHMSANSVDSDQYVDGSIDTAHIADDAVTIAKVNFTGTSFTGKVYQKDAATWEGNEISTSTNLCEYFLLGEICFVFMRMVFSGSGTSGENIYIRAPLDITGSQSFVGGQCWFSDGGNRRTGQLVCQSASDDLVSVVAYSGGPYADATWNLGDAGGAAYDIASGDVLSAQYMFFTDGTAAATT